jgi:hypothetical protein
MAAAHIHCGSRPWLAAWLWLQLLQLHTAAGPALHALRVLCLLRLLLMYRLLRLLRLPRLPPPPHRRL